MSDTKLTAQEALEALQKGTSEIVKEFQEKFDKLSKAEQEELQKKYIGFAKLKNKLSHEKGVDNPGAVAAAIGRKKYGNKEFSAMAHKSEEGLEKAKRELGHKAANGNYVEHAPKLKNPPAKSKQSSEPKFGGIRLQSGDTLTETKDATGQKIKHIVVKKGESLHEKVINETIKDALHPKQAKKDLPVKKDPKPLKKDMMGMGENKNKNVPRGPYTGKTSMSMPKAPVPPKAPSLPKPPSAPKPPMAPKPMMAKGESSAIPSKEHEKEVQNAFHLTSKAGEHKSAKAHLEAHQAHNKVAHLMHSSGDKVGFKRHAALAHMHEKLAHFHKSEEEIAKGELAKAHLGGKDPQSQVMTRDAIAHGSKLAEAPKMHEAPVKMPTPEEHAVRAADFASHMPKGKFDDLGKCAYCSKTEHMGEC